MGTTNDKIDPELLIGLVESRPGLWDKSLECHKAFDQRSAAWRDIYKVLCPEYEKLSRKDKHIYAKTVIKKWTNIRDAWRKNIANDNKCKKKQKPYIYHVQLKFLEKNLRSQKKHVNEESTENNLTKQLDKSEFSSDDADAADKVDKFSADGSDAASDCGHCHSAGGDDEGSTSHSVDRKRPVQDFQESEIQFMDMKSLGHQNEDSPHLCFVRGLLPMLNKLSDDDTLDFQLGVIRLLQDIRNKTKNVSNESSPYCGIAASCVGLHVKEDLDHV